MRNGNDLTRPHYSLHDILFTNRYRGFAVGEGGALIYTDDGGHHWMEYERFTDVTLRSMYLAKDGSLLICGDNGSLYRVRPGSLL
jgi:photosystem II stability/assembly factor-like uncharacterized protein